MGRREEMRRKRQEDSNRKRIIAGIAILAGIIIISAAFILPALLVPKATGRPVSSGSNIPNPNVIIPPARDYPQATGSNLGDPNAPVKVMVFFNFYCGHCKTFAEVSEVQIVEEYVDKGLVYLSDVAFTWTDQAFLAAQASYCASDQGKYWEYRDIVFANISNSALGPLDSTNLIDLAQPLGLDVETFGECVLTQKYADKVLQEIDLAKSLGLRGTPTFMVNDTIVYANTLIEAIESELKRQ